MRVPREFAYLLMSLSRATAAVRTQPVSAPSPLRSVTMHIGARKGMCCTRRRLRADGTSLSVCCVRFVQPILPRAGTVMHVRQAALEAICMFHNGKIVHAQALPFEGVRSPSMRFLCVVCGHARLRVVNFAQDVACASDAPAPSCLQGQCERQFHAALTPFVQALQRTETTACKEAIMQWHSMLVTSTCCAD